MPSSDVDTERVAFVQYIKPGQTEAYRDLHENVPEYVEDAMERAGVEDFRVFMRDDIAVCVMDVHDIEEYVEVMGDDPKRARRREDDTPRGGNPRGRRRRDGRPGRNSTGASSTCCTWFRESVASVRARSMRR